MVTRNLPKGGDPKHSIKGRLKGAFAGFFAAFAWMLLAGWLPYETVTPYWAEAATWGPVLLMVLAGLSLLKGLYNLAWAARLVATKPPRLAAPFRERARTGPPAPSRAADSGQPGSARPDGRQRDKPRTLLPAVSATPTVRRMR